MKRTQLILDTDQRAAIEATWEASTNLSIPQYVERIKEQLVKIAESDLQYARKAAHLVGQTKHGTLALTYVQSSGDKPVYRIVTADTVLWVGSKAGAVTVLVNAYKITTE